MKLGRVKPYSPAEAAGLKVSPPTYVEYRAVSGVLQNIDPPPLHPASVNSPCTKDGGGGYTLAGRWGDWGVNILEDAIHWIGLLQYNLSTG